jgi:hypothetical protein
VVGVVVEEEGAMAHHPRGRWALETGTMLLQSSPTTNVSQYSQAAGRGLNGGGNSTSQHQQAPASSEDVIQAAQCSLWKWARRGTSPAACEAWLTFSRRLLCFDFRASGADCGRSTMDAARATSQQASRPASQASRRPSSGGRTGSLQRAAALVCKGRHAD